jgi:hypothetical protein
VQGAVEWQLATRGIRASTAGSADLLVHYHASIDTRIDVSASERQYERCQGNDCSSWVQEYEAGTLVLDVVDARTNRLIWRGWTQDGVQAFDNRDQMTKKIAEAVERMMRRFPRPGRNAQPCGRRRNPMTSLSRLGAAATVTIWSVIMSGCALWRVDAYSRAWWQLGQLSDVRLGTRRSGRNGRRAPRQRRHLPGPSTRSGGAPARLAWLREDRGRASVVRALSRERRAASQPRGRRAVGVVS